MAFDPGTMSLADLVVERHQVALGVELEGAEVEVGRAHYGDEAVRHQGLGVQDGLLVLEDPYPSFEERPVVAVPGPADDGHVRPSGEHQPHVHSASGGLFQDPQSPVTRSEVGVGDPERPLRRRGDGREHRR